jgi:CheY-like chemotaxis protein
VLRRASSCRGPRNSRITVGTVLYRRVRWEVSGSTATMSATRATVLIVDDNASVIDTLARMLRLDGYDVLTAVDAEEAWRQVTTTRTDAILLDLRMPLVDGVMFLRRLRAQESGRHTPVAIITGDYFIDDSLAHELRDLDAVVRFKPLWLEDVVTLVDRLLRTTH